MIARPAPTSQRRRHRSCHSTTTRPVETSFVAKIEQQQATRYTYRHCTTRQCQWYITRIICCFIIIGIVSASLRKHTNKHKFQETKQSRNQTVNCNMLTSRSLRRTPGAAGANTSARPLAQLTSQRKQDQHKSATKSKCNLNNARTAPSLTATSPPSLQTHIITKHQINNAHMSDTAHNGTNASRTTPSCTLSGKCHRAPTPTTQTHTYTTPTIDLTIGIANDGEQRRAHCRRTNSTQCIRT